MRTRINASMVGSSDSRSQRIVHNNREASLRAARANYVRVWCINGWVNVPRTWWNEHRESFRGWENVEE